MAEEQVAKSRSAELSFDQGTARAMDLLASADPDYPMNIETLFATPAFYVGVAVALYLTTTTSPLTLEGAR